MTDRPYSFAVALDGGRFWRDLQEVAAIGGLEPRGVRRLTLDDCDNDARLWLADRGRELDCDVAYDLLGNVYVRREGTNPELAPLMVGSHLDSQPWAGAYDGALGVVSALAVLRGLQEQGVSHRRPIEVVSWTNEEGARFTPGTSGSAWFAGQRSYDDIVRATDDEGIRFSDALARCRWALDDYGLTFRSRPYSPWAFVELHIEQGPLLENMQVPVGVVSGIQGVNWYSVEVYGKANHAGTTPRRDRADALDGAHELIHAIKQAVYGYDEAIRFTIGRFSVSPGTVNTIPDHAAFTIDLRHPDADILAAIDATLIELTRRHWSGCEVNLNRSSAVDPVAFDSELIATLENSAHAFSPKAPTLMSGAFHDAIHLASVCPTAMLFAPCRDGVSHHPDEHVEQGDAVAAMRTLGLAAATLAELTRS